MSGILSGEAGPLFVAAEIEVYQPGAVTLTEEFGLLAMPTLALALEESVSEVADTIRASDWGYRTRDTDPDGVVVYPQTLDDALAIDTIVPIAPGAPPTGVSWGSLRLLNIDGRYSGTYLSGANPDARAVRVYIGRKVTREGRGVWIDPPWADMELFWSGVAGNWRPGDGFIDVPLRDATYWLEKPIAGSTYLGTGGLEGGDDLKDKRKPRARGGTSGAPIRNVSPVLVDAANLIYQYTDGIGTVEQVYEGGAAVFTRQSNVTDLYVGTTSAGNFRTCNNLGLFQLGSSPVRPITCDVTGRFPSAGVQTKIGNLARYLLAEDCAVPSAFINTSSFTTLTSTYAVDGGIWLDGSDIDGATVVGQVLASVGAALMSSRDGTLRAVALRWPPTVTATYTADKIISVTPQPLPAGLDPPPYRFRVGYQRNYTVQASDLPSTLTSARRTFIKEEWRFGPWSSGDILLRFRTPSDPPIIPTALLSKTDAEATAAELGAIWGAVRRIYDVEVPVEYALQHQEGDGVIIDYPLDDLLSSSAALIIGTRIRLSNATAVLRVVV